MIFFAKIFNLVATFVSFFTGYFYGDYKNNHDHQLDLQEESPQSVSTTTPMPPVVSKSSISKQNSSYFGSSQTAELPIDVIFSTLSRYWNYFGCIILFYGMLTFGYRIFKWLKGTRTRRAISETAEPISPKSLILEPHSSPHPSPMLGFRRKSLQDKPNLSQIQESAIEISQ
uniref:Uncharacterized protein n=1 Tax=Panagrolaimus sp. JU765 TaxID=591449 RepID=A0AC34R997_9BILA